MFSFTTFSFVDIIVLMLILMRDVEAKKRLTRSRVHSDHLKHS